MPKATLRYCSSPMAAENHTASMRRTASPNPNAASSASTSTPKIAQGAQAVDWKDLVASCGRAAVVMPDERGLHSGSTSLPCHHERMKRAVSGDREGSELYVLESQAVPRVVQELSVARCSPHHPQMR